MTFEKISKEDTSGELKDKVILLHGFSGKQITMIMDYYKANADFPKASFAVITPVTRTKRVKDVIQDIVQDARRGGA